MLSCDYNGWADVPEDEREGVDAFELTHSVLRVQIRPLPLPVRKVQVVGGDLETQARSSAGLRPAGLVHESSDDHLGGRLPVRWWDSGAVDCGLIPSGR